MNFKKLIKTYTFWAATFTALATLLPIVEKLANHSAPFLSLLPEIGTIIGAWATVSGARNALFKIESPSVVAGPSSAAPQGDSV